MEYFQNWTANRNGASFEIRFFGNDFYHVERTMIGAFHYIAPCDLKGAECGIEPCRGGGYECVIRVSEQFAKRVATAHLN